MHQYQFSLVFFTVMTQWSIGSLMAVTLYQALAPADSGLKHSKQIALFIWGICALGSVSSLAHMGSPLQGYYALRGLSHSWMSREVVAFGLLNGLMTLWAMSHFVTVKPVVQKLLGLVTSVFGLAGILIAGQIYFQVEHHPEWNTILTHAGFVGTALLLGMATLTLFIRLSEQPVHPIIRCVLGGSVLFAFVIIALFGQLTGLETVGFLVWYRIFACILVGVFLVALARDIQIHNVGLIATAVLLMVSGEIAGRMSFFSSVMSKMPW